MELNRRNFLKLSGVGIAGSITFVNINAKSLTPSSVTKTNSQKLIYRTLGRTGIKLPIVSIGAMRADNPALMKAAIDAGVTHFDTAQSYQNGKNEEMLGAFLKDYKRNSYTIATKIGLKQVISLADFMSKIDESLKRLQLDYIDILYLHAVSDKAFILNPEVINLLNEAKKSGKVKFVGLSTHRNMAEILRGAVEAKIYDVVLTSYNFRLPELPDLEVSIEEAAKAGIGIVAMKTMAGGYWDTKEKTKKINIKAALKWALGNENIHTSIPGVTSFDQLDECISVMEDLALTDQEKKDLESDGTTASLFCLGCEECMTQCPYNVPIPDIMRSYMYAYGYRDLKLAREVTDGLSEAEKSCTLCTTCNVVCRQGFNIQAKAKNILRIQDIPADFLV